MRHATIVLCLFIIGALVAVTFHAQVANSQPPAAVADLDQIGSSVGQMLTAAGDHSTRRRFTGRQLFDHEWQVVDPKSPANLHFKTKPKSKSRFEARETFQTKGTLEAIETSVRSGIASATAFPSGAVVEDGLGPLHNGTSCKTCHVAGGGSGVKHNVTLITVDPRSVPVAKGRRDRVDGSEFKTVFPGLVNPRRVLIFDTVVHDRSTRGGYDQIRGGLAKFVPGGLEDAWFKPEQRTVEAIAKQPVKAGRYGDVDFYLSQRNSPPLFGLAAIESISMGRLEKFAEQQAVDTGGNITGRVAGKFGWRGQVNTLAAFVRSACAGELGLNLLGTGQPADPADAGYVNMGQDMSEQEVMNLISYVASIPRPVEQRGKPHSVKHLLSGEKLFSTIGCATCHVAELQSVTGMFSDLLLHDMGERLQSPSPAPIGTLTNVTVMRPVSVISVDAVPASSAFVGAGYYGSESQSLPTPYDFERPEEPTFPRGELPFTLGKWPTKYDGTWDALQREWRTAPLWGIADTAPYLHDGRAATLEAAIQWHGGEAESARVAFERLDANDKALVIDFLSSLRAPEMAPIL